MNYMQYELMTLTKGSLGDAKAKDVSKKVAEVVESVKGKVTNSDYWGKRKLAYKIRQETDGYYEVLDLELEADQLDPLKKKLNLENDLVRYLITAKS
jgi:small subunit ribosomal protein S6